MVESCENMQPNKDSQRPFIHHQRHYFRSRPKHTHTKSPSVVGSLPPSKACYTATIG